MHLLVAVQRLLTLAGPHPTGLVEAGDEVGERALEVVGNSREMLEVGLHQ